MWWYTILLVRAELPGLAFSRPKNKFALFKKFVGLKMFDHLLSSWPYFRSIKVSTAKSKMLPFLKQRLAFVRLRIWCIVNMICIFFLLNWNSWNLYMSGYSYICGFLCRRRCDQFFYLGYHAGIQERAAMSANIFLPRIIAAISYSAHGGRDRKMYMIPPSPLCRKSKIAGAMGAGRQKETGV